MLHVEIGRTVCEKKEHCSLDSCHFQKKKKLQQVGSHFHGGTQQRGWSLASSRCVVTSHHALFLLKMLFFSCPNMAHDAKNKQQPAELCHLFPFYLQMLKCYFEVWIVPWLQKAHVPVALCRWPTFPRESVICRGSAIVSFSLSGLLRPKVKWGTAVQNQHRTLLSKHMVGFFLPVPEEDAQNLSDKEKTCCDQIHCYPVVYLFFWN